MIKLFAVLFAAHMVCFAAAPPDNDTPLAVAQRLFEAMSAHDAARARALFIPEAMLYSVHPDGTAVGMSYEKWVSALGASKDAWLERIWKPQVLEHGSVAAVWAEYDFHLNGKLTHCGIDSFNLLKTADGWKIAAISDTRETSGCRASPLDSPSK